MTVAPKLLPIIRSEATEKLTLTSLLFEQRRRRIHQLPTTQAFGTNAQNTR